MRIHVNLRAKTRLREANGDPMDPGRWERTVTLLIWAFACDRVIFSLFADWHRG